MVIHPCLAWLTHRSSPSFSESSIQACLRSGHVSGDGEAHSEPDPKPLSNHLTGQGRSARFGRQQSGRLGYNGWWTSCCYPTAAVGLPIVPEIGETPPCWLPATEKAASQPRETGQMAVGQNKRRKKKTSPCLHRIQRVHPSKLQTAPSWHSSAPAEARDMAPAAMYVCLAKWRQAMRLSDDWVGPARQAASHPAVTAWLGCGGWGSGQGGEGRGGRGGNRLEEGRTNLGSAVRPRHRRLPRRGHCIPGSHLHLGPSRVGGRSGAEVVARCDR